jgi:FkbM family methyltransferase
MNLRKVVRTAQSYLHFMKTVKDAYYYHSRRILRRPHEVEFHALKLIPDDLPGSYVDVGANHGQSILSIRLMKPHARIYSFEANPLLARKLAARYQGDDSVTVFPYGLGNEDSRQPLFVPVYRKFVYDGDASFDRETATALLSPQTVYLFAPDKVEVREVMCEIRRLDDQKLAPLFLKIDVQGYEAQVVRGGFDTIRTHQPVLLMESWEQEPEVAKMLSALGYEEYLFDDVGFRRGRSANAVNRIFLTPDRAKTLPKARM